METAERNGKIIDCSRIEEQYKIVEQKNKELESLLKYKDEFFSLVSHEFKTPLTVIISAIQAMECACKENLPQKVKEYNCKILQNAYRQLRLVNNLLDITKINSNQMKIEKKNMDIVFLTEAITESVTVYAQQKGVDLFLCSGIPEKIMAIDEPKYERILLNLLSNAIKFTPKDKRVTVKISEKKCKGVPNICIEVEDQGVGIPEDKLEYIFERFGRVENSLTRQAEGTGIGLSLVKMLVCKMGGKILVKSKVGEGSTFAVFLPITLVEEKEDNVMEEMRDYRLVQAIKVEFSDVYLN
jgi:signal transduction histidine kinase